MKKKLAIQLLKIYRWLQKEERKKFETCRYLSPNGVFEFTHPKKISISQQSGDIEF